MSQFHSKPAPFDRATIAAWTMGVVALFAVIWYQIRLSCYIEWGDESETIVAAKMMLAGATLYQDIFNHHGPLAFLPGIITELLGGHTVPQHRIFIYLLQIFALGCLLFSPLIRHVHALVRVTYVMFVATIYVGYLPASYGHTYIYQVMCGLMLSVALSCWLLPLLAGMTAQRRAVTLAGSALVASLPFLAVTYVPVAAALLLAAITRQNWRHVVAGAVAALTFNMGFLLATGSIKGFIAYHLYMNSRILPSYTGGQEPLKIIATAYNAATADLGNLLLLALIIVSLTAAAARWQGFPWRHILVALGLGSLLMRGGAMQGLGYFYAALAMPLLLLTLLPSNVPVRRSMMFVLCAVLLARLILGFPDEKRIMSERQIPQTSEFAEIAKALTGPDDRILAYSFQNIQYILADRLPSSGYYFYLPWQREYLDKAVLGIRIDPCEDLRRNKPKLIMLDEWNVGDQYSWASYGDCIIEQVARDYVRVTGSFYYVRKDLAEQIGLSTGAAKEIVPSAAAQVGDHFDLQDARAGDSAKPVRIGVLFGTHARTNEGVAVLSTTQPSGERRDLASVALPELVDNSFAYFNVPADAHGDLWMGIKSGGGVSVWESRDDQGNLMPCTVVEYAVGPPTFTPGCPIDVKILSDHVKH